MEKEEEDKRIIKRWLNEIKGFKYPISKTIMIFVCQDLNNISERALLDYINILYEAFQNDEVKEELLSSKSIRTGIVRFIIRLKKIKKIKDVEQIYLEQELLGL